VEQSLLDQWQAGQDILFYGPVQHASAQLREAIGVDSASGLDGILDLESSLPADRFRQGAAAGRLHHRSLTSAGPVDTVASAASRQVETCASVSAEGQRRVYATFRAAANGQAKLGWLRGTLSAGITNAKLPVADDPAKLFPAAALLRHLLSRFGLDLNFENSSPGTRNPLLLGARSNNGYFLSGYSPSSATILNLTFPWGAPVLSGCDAWLESPHAQYTMPRAWHRELRCFVQQEAAGEVSCAEVCSEHPGIRRRLALRGLRNASVHFLPERGTRPIFAVNDLRPQNDQSIPYETHDGGRRLSVGPVTGTLLISW
jgi:hypothetical protein